jgi:hypothetical protein
MTMSEVQRQRYLERAARALGTHEVPDAVTKVRAIVGPRMIPVNEEAAQRAWTKIRDKKQPEADELASLEVIIRLLRPAVLSRGGELDDLPDQQGRNLYPAELKDVWSSFRGKVKDLLYSIGRIDFTDGTHVGTGFLVRPGVLATNQHVLDDLTMGTGLLRRGVAEVRFQREQGGVDAPEHVLPIDGVVAMHDYLDMALLSVPGAGDRPLIEVATGAVPEGMRVAAVGYPAKDGDRNPMFVGAVFGATFGVKRAAIGEIRDGTRSPDVYHDCSTLGGNSGSPVFSLESGKAVAIHAAGTFMYRNDAIDGDHLSPFVNA